MAPDDVDEIVEIGVLGIRGDQEHDRSICAVDRSLVDVFNARNPLEVRDCRLELALDLIDLGFVAASLGQINRHRLTI